MPDSDGEGEVAEDSSEESDVVRPVTTVLEVRRVIDNERNVSKGYA